MIAAGTLSHLLPRWLHREGRTEPRRRPIALEWLLLGAVVLYAVQASYSTDHTKAAENVAFFYIPFGLLFMLLRDVHWTRELVLKCLRVAVALAVVFAGIGFVEYYRKTLFLNPKVDRRRPVRQLLQRQFIVLRPQHLRPVPRDRDGRRHHDRAVDRRRREVLIAAGVLAWLLAGLITSFSQSSIAALLLGMAVLAAYRWDVRATIYVAGALIAIAVVFVLAAPPSLHFGLNGSGGSTSNATSGRTKLISGGLELFADRPIYGYGSGSFETEYRAPRERERRERDVGLAHDPDHGRRRAGDHRVGRVCRAADRCVRRPVRGAGRSPPRIALAACFAALVLHTWTYADFLEDPITWTLLGIGVGLRVSEMRGDGDGRGDGVAAVVG